MKRLQVLQILATFVFFLIILYLFRSVSSSTCAVSGGLNSGQAALLQSKIDAQIALWDRVRTNSDLQIVYESEKRIWDLFDTIADCFTTERVGPPGTRGRWLCNFATLEQKRHPKPVNVYCFGGHNGVEFETYLNSKYNVESHSFEQSKKIRDRMEKLVNPNMTVHAMGLGPVWEHLYASQALDAPIKPLMKITRELRVRHIDILKIDIEGSEYSAIPTFLKDPGFRKLGVSILVVELHYFGESWGMEMLDVLALFENLLDAGFYIYHKEANYLCGPGCVEFSFVHRDLLGF